MRQVPRRGMVLLAGLAFYMTLSSGCRTNLSLYNPDGSLNTANQVQILRTRYIRMSSRLNDGETREAVKYMMMVEQLARLLPEVPGNTSWNEARGAILKNISGMQSALRIGDSFAARSFARKAGAGVHMCWTLGPMLFTKDGKLKNIPQPIAPVPEVDIPPEEALPVSLRPPGLYDD